MTLDEEKSILREFMKELSALQERFPAVLMYFGDDGGISVGRVSLADVMIHYVDMNSLRIVSENL